jgi:predicted Zn-dependent peptidase
LIYDEFENLLFKGHPLGHNILGNAEQLRTYTTADALRFVHRNYRPEKMVFFVYGDIDFKRLCKTLEHLTPDSSKASHDETSPLTIDIQKQSLLIEQDRSTHQAHVMIGCQAYAYNDPRRIALFLLNNILGGPGMNARLNLSLRERHGLVYTVESTMVTYGDTGTWSTYFGCDHHDVNRCRKLVRHELDRLMQKPLSQRQLMMAKRQLKGQLAIACDNREQFALDFGRSFLHHGHERDLDTLYRYIDGLTTEELQAVACELFAPEHMTTLVFR